MAVYAGNVTIGVRYETDAAARGLQNSMSQTGQQAGAALNGAMQTKLDMLATKMASAGRNMFYSFTLPLVAVGKKSADAFLPFEKALTNIEGLVGIDHQTVQAWGQEIQATAPKFGVLADEATRAMYFITSSGIEASDAMMVLNASLTATQAGLGTTEVVADVVTTALNAYGLSADHATEITDQLTVAVREGKAEASDLAVAVGRVVPIASQMGVSFDQVAGSIAAMTLSGAKADEAATQLSQVMNTLLDPSQQAKETLAQVGITAEQLRETISKDGLQAGLTELSDAFGGNVTQMTQVFGNIRALRGMFNLTGKTAEQTASILRQTAAASGETAKAAEIAANSVGGKLDKSLASLNSRMIDVGASVVPFFAGLVDGATAAAGAFNILGPSIQPVVIGLAALAAAGGPALLVGSSIVRGWSAVSGIVSKAGKAIFELGAALYSDGIRGGFSALRQGINSIGTGGAIATATASIIGLALAFKQASDTMSAAGDNVRKRIADHGEAIGGGMEGLDNQLANAKRVQAEFIKIRDYKGLSNPLERLGVNEQVDKTDELVKHLEQLRSIAGSVSGEFNVSADAMADFLTTMEGKGIDVSTPEKAAEAWRKYAGSQDAAAAKTAATASALGQLRAAAESSMGAFVGVVDAQRAADASTRSLADAEKNLVDAQQKRKDLDVGGVESTKRMADARKKAADAEHSLTDAVKSVTEARKKLSDLERGLSTDEQLSVESAQLSLDEAIASQKDLGKNASDLERRRADLSVRQARQSLEQAQRAHGEALGQARDELATAQRSADDALAAKREADIGVMQTQTDITKDLAEATKAERDAAIGVEDARWAQFKAYDALVPAQATFNALVGTNADEQKKASDYIGAMVGQYPELASAAESAYARIAAARDAAIPKVADQRTLTDLFRGTPAAPAEQRANGGPLGAGQLSTVNERGLPEMWQDDNGNQFFLPTTGGRVIPLSNSTLGAGTASKGHTGPGVQTGDINIYEAKDGREAEAGVRRGLRKQSFLAGGR